jgi:thiamine pyrophosphate-dependent acetolactate synthase large subunit-like protein
VSDRPTRYRALGSGLPTALGAVAANPDAPVVVLAGDGGFLMGGHELATAQQNGLHFVTLLVNDSCFGVLKNYQMSAYGHSSSVELRSPDFEQLAAGYGVGYRRIEDTSQAGDALREAIAGLDGGCRLIELQAELAHSAVNLTAAYNRPSGSRQSDRRAASTTDDGRRGSAGGRPRRRLQDRDRRRPQLLEACGSGW